MTRRSGFALLTVLWLLFILGLVLPAALAPIVASGEATENRIHLGRAKWAALGCLELSRSRFERGEGVVPLDSVALGMTVWCTAEPLNADERINPNTADSLGLSRALGDRSRAASLLDWIDSDDVARAAGAERDWYDERGRPTPRNDSIRSTREIALVRGFEETSASALNAWFTVHGDGRISANRGPGWALASIGAFSREDISRIVASRRSGVVAATTEELLSVADVELDLDALSEVTRRLSFADDTRTTRFSGHVNAGERTLRYDLLVTLQSTPGGLIIQRLEVE